MVCTALGLGVVAMLGVSLALPPGAAADELTFGGGFSATAPDSPTGMSLHLVYPDGPDGRPKPPRVVVIDLPEGTSIDDRALPACEATDAEINAFGADACPPDTQLGGGTLTASTGIGPPVDPVTAEQHIFHGPGELINVITPPGSQRPVFTIARIKRKGRTFTDRPTLPPGWPPPTGQTTPKQVDQQIKLVSRNGRAFVTTPRDCPPTGVWTARLTITYQDSATQTATSSSPCTRAQRQPVGRRLPPVTLSITPHRVRAHQWVRVRFNVRSSSPNCRSRATIRLADARTRTDDRGRATLVTRFRYAGRYRARTTHPGCRTAIALIAVRHG